MSITPLLALGLPMVRILLRLQEPSASDLADSLKDFQELVASVQDEGDRREIARNLEHISDRVVRRLDQFIQVEFRNIGEGDVAAAAGVVSQALARAGTADLTTVVRSDVQVRALEQHTLTHSLFRAQAAELGGDPERLAHALLRESCFEVVELARRHPNLTVSALTSLLVRSSEMRELLDAVERSLQDLPARIAALGGADRRSDHQREVDEFSVDYRRAVANDYDRLELYGVDLIRDVRRYSLTTAYLSLRLAMSASRSEGAKPVDLAKILPEHGGIVILRGAAGAGKTTLLQWLATSAARQTLGGSLEHLNARVPFVIKLRNYVSKPFPDVDDFAAVTTRSNLQPEPEGWSRDAAQGSILLLVDGLDELPSRRQREFIDWIDDFQRLRSQVLTVITSRPAAWTSLRDLSQLRGDEVRVADVLPMDREQIRSFVLHWHTAIALQLTGAERAAVEGQAAKVAGVVSSAREYRLLASSPLLCAVLCALFHLKRGVLPANRIEIYDTLLNLLLGDRDAHKRVEVDEVRLSPTEKRLILEDVADFLLTNGLSESTFARVERVIARSPLAHRFAPATAADILRHLLARSGVLRAPSEGTVDFVHRTFLEYLAARSLVRHDKIEMLAGNALQANWNEAVVLAAGIGIDRQVETLVATVLQRVETGQGDRQADKSMLTATCAGFLDTAVMLPEGARSRILEVIREVVPPENEPEARACASAGNSILPYLRSALTEAEISAGALRMAIRTLGEIGTVEALAVLGAIPAERRLSAIEALVSVWSWFDPKSFAEVVLKDLAPPGPMTVVLPSSTVLPHLHGLHEHFEWHCVVEVPEKSFADNCRQAPVRRLAARNLNILHDARVATGQFLWTMPELRTLSASGLTSLRPAADGVPRAENALAVLQLRSNSRCDLDADLWPHLPHLTEVSLDGDFVCDFSGVDSTLLTRLHLVGNIALKEWKDFGLGGLTELRVAGLTDPDLLWHLVGQAPHLRHLVVEDLREVYDLAFVAGLPRLEVLELHGLGSLSDIATLGDLDRLTSVTITGQHRLNWSPILERLSTADLEFRVDFLDLEISMARRRTRSVPWLDVESTGTPEELDSVDDLLEEIEVEVDVRDDPALSEELDRTEWDSGEP
ncbi:NACHT domain-containing protein [Actinoplanes sp. NPDC048967]|uniref:NACHT domain-containing protein n=1 Tax=Actinoplanes sp. NPDC048967 TaxID=3155269 RepID=UPI0033E13AF0